MLILDPGRQEAARTPPGQEMLALWRTCSIMITAALAGTLEFSQPVSTRGLAYLPVGQQKPCTHLGQTFNHVGGLPCLSAGTRHGLKTKWSRGQPHLPAHLQESVLPQEKGTHSPHRDNLEHRALWPGSMLGPEDIGNIGSPPRLGKELTYATEMNTKLGKMRQRNVFQVKE